MVTEELLQAVQAATKAILVARNAIAKQTNRDAGAVNRAWERGERHQSRVLAE